MQVRLTRNNVLVKEHTPQMKRVMFSDGVELPRNTGRVIAISDKVEESKKISIGDNIFYSKYAGVNIPIDGVNYVLLSVNEIFGFIEQDISQDDFEIGETTDLIAIFERMQQSYMNDDKSLILP